MILEGWGWVMNDLRYIHRRSYDDQNVDAIFDIIMFWVWISSSCDFMWTLFAYVTNVWCCK